MRNIGIVIFIISVLLAIGLHELGHFATAKWFKIKVDRFFIGFGPRLWSVKKGETEYGIAAFPLGGYVRIAGMSPLEEIPPEDQARTFKAKPPWQRAIVLAAGSFTHFVIALIILASIIAIAGKTDYETATLQIAEVGAADPKVVTPSMQAGMKPGDVVVAVDGQTVTDWEQVRAAIRARPGQTLEILVRRGGRTLTLRPTLGMCVRLVDGKNDCVAPYPAGETIGFLGVSPEFRVVDYSVGGAIVEAGKGVGVLMKQSVFAFKNIFTPSSLSRLFKVATGSEQRKDTDPTSLVGIGKLSGDAASRGDFASLFLLVVSFNVFVGVVNLLPLPPLDGGHLAVLGYEKITRRTVDMRKLLPVTAMVLSVFAMLFVLLLYTDIVNPLRLPG